MQNSIVKKIPATQNNKLQALLFYNHHNLFSINFSPRRRSRLSNICLTCKFVPEGLGALFAIAKSVTKNLSG